MFRLSPRATNTNHHNIMSALSKSRVIGFFSLPSSHIAEHNPEAYYAALASAPAGAGTCSQCGMGILHHVVIKGDDGITRFIGSDCALRVGISRESVTQRLTSDQIAARNAKRAEQVAEWQLKRQAEEDARAVRLAERREKVGTLVDMLRSFGGEFYDSLADQLEVRPLTCTQARYVANATSSTGRRNKKNAVAYDAVWSLCAE